MSLNVLVIPEDFRKDQYVLKPIVEATLRSIGTKPRVVICKDPLLGGVGEAMKWKRLEPILDRYRGMTDVFLLIVDRDGKPRRCEGLDRIERRAERSLRSGAIFLGENAWQEVEVWVLAGLKDLPKRWTWAEIRQELDPKEVFYIPFATHRGVAGGPYEGRDELAREAARNYPRIRRLCPEDVGRLHARIEAALKDR